MKKLIIVFVGLLPLFSYANTTYKGNTMHQSGFNPSQQRMQSQMLAQQQQQQMKLQQDEQSQMQNMQRQMQEQRTNNQQRVLNSQPGH